MVIEDSKHFDYTDIPHFSFLAEKLKISGKIDKSDLMNILNQIIINFFDYYINDGKIFNVEDISKKHEKLILLKLDY